ncbi:MAG: hypothetical protein HY017_18750 [Betaproteobacteria bacterium]|nr:hypothetical protein [Betaproteobacteria bacterium]
MESRLALRVLGEIMGWPDEQAEKEFRWLRLMARLKYNGYEDFRAGARFLESLATWLQQFDREDRAVAYEFVRRRLIYIGESELQRLVELFYPRTLEKRLLRQVAAIRSIPPYKVWTVHEARDQFTKLRRQTLIMALSDGARVDQLRRATTPILSNEQFVGMTQVDDVKWDDLVQKLRTESKDKDAKFAQVVLVDDFMGTGSTVLRRENGSWTGRLVRFRHSIDRVQGGVASLFEPTWKVVVHHYIAVPGAIDAVAQREVQARGELGVGNWFPEVAFTYELAMPNETSMSSDARLVRLTEKYYNSAIETDSTRKGGYDRINLGYGACALPLVLDHNTPNNSVPLLWAECEASDRDGTKEPETRPLFRRRQRHVS